MRDAIQCALAIADAALRVQGKPAPDEEATRALYRGGLAAAQTIDRWRGAGVHEITCLAIADLVNDYHGRTSWA